MSAHNDALIPLIRGIEGGHACLPDPLTHLSNEVARLRSALLDIVDPMSAIEREAKANGTEFIWKQAVLLAHDPEYLKSIARRALQG